MRVHAVLLLGFAAACGVGPGPSVGDTDATSADLSGTTDGDASTSHASGSSDTTTTSGVGETHMVTAASADTTSAVVESTGSSATPDSSSGVPATTAADTTTSGRDSGESATTGADTTTSGTDSGESSSTSGVEYPTCFTEAWTVAIPEVFPARALAVVGDTPIFVAGNTVDDGGWVGAWDQDGSERWSRTIDPADLGLDDAVGAVVDIDAFPNGDALLSYSRLVEHRAAVFARLDGATGDVIWATSIGVDELVAFDDGWGLFGGEAHAAAITESGRVFVVGFALVSTATEVWFSELVESDGTLLGTSGLFSFDPVNSGIGDFLADDDVGAFLSYSGGGGSFALGVVIGIAPSGEMLASIGGNTENSVCGSQAIDLDGNITISCVWAESWEFPPSEVINYLERRTPDDTLLQGGFGEPPALGGRKVFDADGDLIIMSRVEPAIYKLGDEHNILSVDPHESTLYGVAALPDGDLIVRGWEDGASFLRRYAGCEL